METKHNFLGFRTFLRWGMGQQKCIKIFKQGIMGCSCQICQAPILEFLIFLSISSSSSSTGCGAEELPVPPSSSASAGSKIQGKQMTGHSEILVSRHLGFLRPFLAVQSSRNLGLGVLGVPGPGGHTQQWAGSERLCGISSEGSEHCGISTVRSAVWDEKFGISSEGSAVWDHSQLFPHHRMCCGWDEIVVLVGAQLCVFPVPMSMEGAGSWAALQLHFLGSGVGLSPWLCFGSVNGDVRFFDPRMPESMKVLQIELLYSHMAWSLFGVHWLYLGISSPCFPVPGDHSSLWFWPPVNALPLRDMAALTHSSARGCSSNFVPSQHSQ
ncbi:hypothetical protein DV515_00013960 [Chloebia gouldiae]|uniref:Uncharacterized protein n=1 Tax=Chloebia gouldiae TaxID=44316 RepID=A0A3L8RZM1_CHLGU|nr:hypothetical protein DV515_00013960 [Chloebia gouldiae]